MMFAKTRPNPRQTVRTETVPAPIRGLNFKDSLAAMKPTDALVLDNFFCRPSYVEVMQGSQDHVTGFGSTVETLIPYFANSGTGTLFAAAGTSIYDVTAAGALGAAVVTGMTSAYWSYTTISNIGGNVLILANGVDAPRSYNGAAWSAWSVTGVTPANLSFVTTWKRRVWAIEKNTFRAWYLPVDAVSGTMTSFDFKAIFTRGGHLVSILTWTLDGGSGLDDLFVAITSEGEVAIYQGSDPATASTFGLIGVYYIGEPIGARHWVKFGGDLVILTSQGLVELSQFVKSSSIQRLSNITQRIQPRLIEDINSYRGTQGWEMTLFYEENMLLIQVPSGSVGSRYQWAMNTLSGAWSRFLKQDAVTFAVFEGALYAGLSTKVVNAWTSGTQSGTPIQYTLVPAFSYFGSPTNGKRFTLGRAIIEANGALSYQTKLLRDFNTTFSFPSGSAPALSGALWGTAIWGSSIWGGGSSFYRRWYSLAGHAYSATVAIQGQSRNNRLRFHSFDYSFEVGGVL